MPKSIASVPAQLTNILFGYDIFISYAHADGTDYAAALAKELSAYYTVHLDTERYHAGQDLRTLTRIRVKNSKLLVVVGTKAACMNSHWVQREVEIFSEMGRSPIVIDVDNSVRDSLENPPPHSLAQWIADQREVTPGGKKIDPIIRETDTAVVSSTDQRLPADHIATRILDRFTGDRVEKRRLQVVTGTLIALVCAILVVLLAYLEAERQRSIADDQRNRAEEASEKLEMELSIESRESRLGYRFGYYGNVFLTLYEQCNWGNEAIMLQDFARSLRKYDMSGDNSKCGIYRNISRTAIIYSGRLERAADNFGHYETCRLLNAVRAVETSGIQQYLEFLRENGGVIDLDWEGYDETRRLFTEYSRLIGKATEPECGL